MPSWHKLRWQLRPRLWGSDRMTNPTDIPGSEDIKEQLADIEHQRWADWQKWMHSLTKDLPLGARGVFRVIPQVYFDRWERQINTSYADLTAAEKAADMEQVNRYWPLIETLLINQRNKILDMVMETLGEDVDHAECCDLKKKWDNMDDVSCSCEAVFINERNAELRAAFTKLRSEK